MTEVQPFSRADLTLKVAVVGPTEVVTQVLTIGNAEPVAGVSFRMLPVTGADDREAIRRMATVQPEDLDVFLFTSPVTLAMAEATYGELSHPASTVLLSGGALFASLLRGLIEQVCDPEFVSIDTLSSAEVAEAYSSIGLSPANVEIAGAGRDEEELVQFHLERRSAGRATAAVTCVGTVADRLRGAGVPVLRVLPSDTSIRSALRRVALLGSRDRVEGSQIALVLCQVSPETSRVRQDTHAAEVLRLSLHQVLIREAEAMDSSVHRVSRNEFLLISTFGSVATATNDFRYLPLAQHARDELGIELRIGIGFGTTAREAMTCARDALERALESETANGVMVGYGGGPIELLASPDEASLERELVSAPVAPTAMQRLAELLDGRRDPIVLDAEQVADLLDVAPRSARRILRQLAEEGLAWRLPPTLGSGRGRPKSAYRLKLRPDTAAAPQPSSADSVLPHLHHDSGA